MKHDIYPGFRIPCDICDYTAGCKGDLLKHKRSVHDKIRYSCDKCEFSATQKSYLNKHMEKMHPFQKFPVI